MVGDSAATLYSIVERHSIDFEDEDLLEVFWGFPVNSVERNQDIESLIIVIVNFIAKGVIYTGTTSYWVHL